MTAYYNEFDPYAAQWLRNLIDAGHIAPGVVDERSIVDVRPDDLAGFTQCHFFAGIGVWSYALRLAGWPDDRSVWTGSCPCQPFSAAGKGKGFDDERHLWPEFHRLISECRPPVVFGEQVASKDGLGWLDTVQSDMEASGYAIGAADLCAAGIGAPHIRQRLWFVGERLADAVPAGWAEGRPVAGNGSPASSSTGGLEYAPQQQQHGGRNAGPSGRGEHPDAGATGGLGNADGSRGTAWIPEPMERKEGLATEPDDRGHRLLRPSARQPELGGVADYDDDRRSPRQWDNQASRHRHSPAAAGRDDRQGSPRPTNGHWRDADWLHCRDGKWRPVEPGTFPLVNGATARVGRLRAYGNAIVPQVAENFVRAYLEWNAETISAS